MNLVLASFLELIAISGSGVDELLFNFDGYYRLHLAKITRKHSVACFRALGGFV